MQFNSKDECRKKHSYDLTILIYSAQSYILIFNQNIFPNCKKHNITHNYNRKYLQYVNTLSTFSFFIIKLQNYIT